MDKPSSKAGRGTKMTLGDYYKSLSPSRIRKTERTEFVDRVCKELEVSRFTVLNWIAGRNVPQKASYYTKLSQITGIPVDNLFPDDNKEHEEEDARDYIEGKTLKDFYYELASKDGDEATKLIIDICAELETDPITVVNWMYGRSLPDDRNVYQVISKITGLPEEGLFIA